MTPDPRPRKRDLVLGLTVLIVAYLQQECLHALTITRVLDIVHSSVSPGISIPIKSEVRSLFLPT